MEKHFAFYNSHCIYLYDNAITIDDFYYSLDNGLSISQIEEIYKFPDGYLQDLVDKYL